MAQLEGSQLSQKMSCEGVSPGQVMAVLFVELRQEVLAQRRRVKEQLKKDNRGLIPNLLGDDDEDNLGAETDHDDDCGIMNKITDRKGRKEFETDMHTLIRSYNDMLAKDLKGIPEVKLQKMFPSLRRPSILPNFAGGKKNGQQRPWLKPGGLTQRLFSFDDIDAPAAADGDPDHLDEEEDESKNSKSSATGRLKAAVRGGMFTGSLLRKTREAQATPTDVIFDSNNPPSERGANECSSEGTGRSSALKASQATRPPPMSLIEESKSEDGTDREVSDRDMSSPRLEIETDLDGVELNDPPDAQKSEKAEGRLQQSNGGTTSPSTGKVNSSGTTITPGKLNQSRLFEIMSLRKLREHQPQDLQSDPGPNQSWNPGESTLPSDLTKGSREERPAMYKRTSTLQKELTKLKQAATETVERYKEDHAMYNKLFIPAEDYETFAGAEGVGNKMMQLRASVNMNMSAMGVVPELSSDVVSNPDRDMSENELLDFMTKCIESRNVESLDFMADFFRDNTISQTMVKSNAQVVWLQDWFPIKDCIYAISVDKKKKRVLVVFRGATTRADWAHGFDAAVSAFFVIPLFVIDVPSKTTYTHCSS